MMILDSGLLFGPPCIYQHDICVAKGSMVKALAHHLNIGTTNRILQLQRRFASDTERACSL